MEKEVCMLAVQIFRLCKVILCIYLCLSDWERMPVCCIPWGNDTSLKLFAVGLNDWGLLEHRVRKTGEKHSFFSSPG